MNRREMVNWLGSFAASTTLARLPAADRLGAARRLHEAPAGAGMLSEEQAGALASLTDAILPRTDTPSATDVGVPQFIEHLLRDWYSEPERAELLQGLTALDALSQQRHGKALAQLDDASRIALLMTLDGQEGPPGSAADGLSRLKSLTVYGFFTSKLIQTQILKNPTIPGRFEGCIPVVR